MDHLVMSPLSILRKLESDKLKTAPSSPEAMDENETVEVLLGEDRKDQGAAINRNATAWNVLTGKTAEIREALDGAEGDRRIELESNLGRRRLELPTAQVNQSRLISVRRQILSLSKVFGP